jgi:hypothetical protein
MRRLLAIGLAPFCGDLANPVDQALRTGRELLPAFVDRLDAVRDDRCRDRDPAGQGHGLGLLGSGRRRVGCANSIASSASTVSASPACVESRGCVPWGQEAALARLAALPRRAEAHRARLAALSFRTVQGARDRGAAPRARDPAPPGRTSRPPPRRPSAPGQPAATAQALDRVFVTPETLARWHHQLVAHRWTRPAGDRAALASPARSASSYGARRARTRAGATGGSPASSPGSGSRYRRRPCESSCATPGSAVGCVNPSGRLGGGSSLVRRPAQNPDASVESRAFVPSRREVVLARFSALHRRATDASVRRARLPHRGA